MLDVLMATHNGASTLPRVLDAYCQLDCPRGGWKLLIVNNGSTDDTDSVIASFQSRLPLTCIREPRLGKNIALNTGLSRIVGDLVVMTDDDAVPQRDWLVQLRHTADSKPSYSVFGGRIVPLWDVPPESWIEPFLHIVSITGSSWPEGPVAAARICGPNMAVRRHVIDAGFRFDVSLGPIGSLYQMGDETDFLQRVSKAGFKTWHCKSAVVGHIIRKYQMNKKWMLRRARANGRHMYRWEYIEYDEHLNRDPALLMGFPRYIIREIVQQAFCFGRSTLVENRDRAFREQWKLEYAIGRALGAREVHQARRRKRVPSSRPRRAHSRAFDS